MSNKLVNDRTVRRRSSNAALFLTFTQSIGAEGLVAFRSFGTPATVRKRRKIHVNPQRESTVYRSRGHGNQHTPPNYPKTRRKRQTRRERSADVVSKIRCIYDHWESVRDECIREIEESCAR